MFRRRTQKPRPGVFDPQDEAKVSVSHVGVWTIYSELPQRRLNVRAWLDWRVLLYWRPALFAASTVRNMSYVGRIMKDLLSCGPWLVIAYWLSSLLGAVFPGLIMYYSGEMLNLVQAALETRKVDEHWLAYIALARALCVAAEWLNQLVQSSTYNPLRRSLDLQFAQHILKAHLRIDLPTYGDAAVARQLESASERNRGGPWSAVQSLVRWTTGIVNAWTTFVVLMSLLWNRKECIPLAIVSLLPPLADAFNLTGTGYGGWGWSPLPPDVAWAATCENEDYIRRTGLRKMAEIVAGNLEGYIDREFTRASEAVGAENIMDVREVLNQIVNQRNWSFKQVLRQILGELPQLFFILQIMRTPESMPLTMAAFTVIQTAVNSFTGRITNMLHSGEAFSDTLEQLRSLYELANIQNTVPDGPEAFPENAQDTAKNGVSIEFRNVSFKYPGSDTWALREVSFKIERGSLCVLVGTNGSGKSSILKLITRLYDVTEGEILVDGRNIRTLKLHDLRNVISTLFQDFKLYPLSIKENIQMGDPDQLADTELIEQVAETCGINDFMDRLPEGLNSYLEHPVPDYFQSLPEGTKTLFGRKVDLSHLRGRTARARNIALSGGQSQKVAVARTMLRATTHAGKTGTERVGLLLFDEPSASLDPEAEYKLFTTLRAIRGDKSMIFSSHRFGNLTKHANVVLFMKDSRITERGTHDELLAKDGAYAHMWRLQAEAFIS
ncbi:P-loop containing nucleoside triphosphate hydrolase protein [Auriculariales sp. MPI-PUGE-AT-0066]|nr:P-loop containing nucleoside triphosphate hydrolase protein [Auriculariales sp. MPI-PUGE-AT-0066]